MRSIVWHPNKKDPERDPDVETLPNSQIKEESGGGKAEIKKIYGLSNPNPPGTYYIGP